MENKDEKVFALLNDIPVSENIDVAVDRGINKYKKQKVQRKKTVYSFAMVAVLIISFVSVIRFSPNIASAFYQIPFLQPLVEMIAYDKGMEDILENEYYEEINTSVTKDGFTVTVTNVVADESGMMVSYKLETDKNLKSFQFSPTIFHGGEPIKGTVIADVLVADGEKYLFENTVEVTNGPDFKLLSNDFELIVELDKDISITVPFTLKNEIKQSKTYVINETLTIENQKFTIKELVISPIRTKMVVSVDPSNSKKILSLGEIRLEDEKGETWGTIRNGVSAMGEITSEDYYLMFQSNYFRTPEELTIHFSNIEVIDRVNDHILVDLATGEILKNEQNIDLEVIDGNVIQYSIKPLNKHSFFDLFNEVVDANGHKFNFNQSSASGYEDKQVYQSTIGAEGDKTPVNPVKLIFNRSLTHLEGEASITVKLK